MPSPEKKRKKMEDPSPPTQKLSTTNPSLPDDLLMSCFARVSRLYYPTLSLVSKSFRSLLASPELYKARSLLGRTESCLYVCIQPFNSDEGPTWYTLCQKPNQTLTNHIHATKMMEKYKRGYVLVKVPILNPPRAGRVGFVSVGSDIYHIGSSKWHESFSSAWVLDSRSHTWHEARSMKVEINSLSAAAVGRKIYVAGSHGESLKFEVSDKETQIWDPKPPVPCSDCIDGEFRVRTDEGSFCYSSHEGRWTIENVRYSVSDGGIVWYDTELNMQGKLEGLVGLPKLPPHFFVRFIGYGGKMAVFWEDYVTCSGQKMIWCAEIALERRGDCQIWGEVEWVDHMLTVPIRYDLLKVLAVTV